MSVYRSGDLLASVAVVVIDNKDSDNELAVRAANSFWHKRARPPRGDLDRAPAFQTPLELVKL